jgi:hypothetical protein
MAQTANEDVRARDEEIARYRRAAEEALDQLEWCVTYLHRIRRTGTARVLDKNRRSIWREMRRIRG